MYDNNKIVKDIQMHIKFLLMIKVNANNLITIFYNK